MVGSRKPIRPEDLFCARCRRPVKLGANRFPAEGYLCTTCYTHAFETYGQCGRCGADRLTPGLALDGGRLCTDCTGIGDFTCERCGREGKRYLRGICGNCVLRDQLTELLDDGTGTVRPQLLPLLDGFSQMRRPRGGLTWVGTTHIQAKLRALALAAVPLTHEGLNQLGTPRSTAYLRDLLMHYDILPKRDRDLLMFENWLACHLDGADQAHRRLLGQFATWNILRKLRDIAARQPVGPGRDKDARLKMTKASEFLDWLVARGKTIDGCAQADLDAWHADHRLARRAAQPFLRWCIRTGKMPRLVVPDIDTRNPAPLSQHRRITLIRRFLSDEQIPLIDRVTATLILLYAQPINRIVRLTTDHITTGQDGTVLLRLGDPPTPVPEPFASLLLQYTATRPNMLTATNPDSRWLFPGRRAGQPLHPETIAGRLASLGLHRTNARTSAIRHLVLQAPAPVVAGMLGYNNESLAQIAAQAAGPWSRYAPGDHTR